VDSARYPLAAMEAAWTDDVGRTVIRLASGAEIVAELPAAEGRELVDALGLGPHARAVRLPFASARVAAREKLRATAGDRVDIGSAVLSIMGPLWLWLVGMGAGVAVWEW